MLITRAMTREDARKLFDEAQAVMEQSLSLATVRSTQQRATLYRVCVTFVIICLGV